MGDGDFAELVGALGWGDGTGADPWLLPAGDLVSPVAEPGSAAPPGLRRVPVGIAPLDVCGGLTAGSLTLVCEASARRGSVAVGAAVYAAEHGCFVDCYLLGATVADAADRFARAGRNAPDLGWDAERLGRLGLRVAAGQSLTVHDVRMLSADADDPAELIVVDRYGLLGVGLVELKRLALDLHVGVVAVTRSAGPAAQAWPATDAGLGDAADAAVVCDHDGDRTLDW